MRTWRTSTRMGEPGLAADRIYGVANAFGCERFYGWAMGRGGPEAEVV